MLISYTGAHDTGTVSSKNSHQAQTHLVIFAVDQSQLKAVLCGVDGEDARPALPVQAVNAVSSHTGHIDGQVQGPDDAMITTGNTIKKFRFNSENNPITS